MTTPGESTYKEMTMKKLYLLLITSLICSLMLFGCDFYTPNENDDLITEDGSTVTKEDNKSNDDRLPAVDDEVPEAEDPKQESNDDSTQEPTIPSDDEDDELLPEIGTKVGDRFADLTIMTMDGGSINTAELRGKIIILNLWATWCPPCKAELPDFDLIASEYKDHVVIIAADVDAGTGNAHSYVQQNFPESDIVFAYDSLYGEAYFAAGGNGYVPYTAIMDQNGVIVYTDSGMLSHSMLVSIIEGLIN